MDADATLRLIQYVPQVNTSAAVVGNVTRNCTSTGPEDFEFFDSAFSVASGLVLSTVAEFDIKLGRLSLQGFPYSWQHTFWSYNIPFYPALGSDSPACFILSDDNGDDDNINAPSTTIASMSGATSPPVALALAETTLTSLVGLPASTGTLFPAASAIPSWDMLKIESYYSAHSQLPTNVNYTQMLQATSVPSDIASAVTHAVYTSTSIPTNNHNAALSDFGCPRWSFIWVLSAMVWCTL